MKGIVRVVVALFGAIFGSLLGSVSTCTNADGQPIWPRWADDICGRNVGFFWLVSAPMLFMMIILLLGRHFVRFRRYAAAVLLATYGLYGLFEAVKFYPWWVALSPAAACMAVPGVALRKHWGRYLVYVLAVLFVAQWGYSIWLAASSGYFRRAGIGPAILSLFPGAAVFLTACFCCYVVTVERSSQSTADPPSLA